MSLPTPNPPTATLQLLIMPPLSTTPLLSTTQPLPIMLHLSTMPPLSTTQLLCTMPPLTTTNHPTVPRTTRRPGALKTKSTPSTKWNLPCNTTTTVYRPSTRMSWPTQTTASTG